MTTKPLASSFILREVAGRSDDGSHKAAPGDLERGLQDPSSLVTHHDSTHAAASIAKSERQEPAIKELKSEADPSEIAILCVVDLGFDGSFKTSVEFKGFSGEQLEVWLLSLPPHPAETARIFICNFDLKELGSALRSYLCNIGVGDIGTPKMEDVSNISNLASQWQERPNTNWFGISPLDDEEWSVYLKSIALDTDKLVGMLATHIIAVHN